MLLLLSAQAMEEIMRLSLLDARCSSNDAVDVVLRGGLVMVMITPWREDDRTMEQAF